MKIVQVSTVDTYGGAGRAAYRLHRGLLQLGQVSLMLVLSKFSSDETVVDAHPTRLDAEKDEFFLSAIQSHYIDFNRTQISNTLFSLHYPGFDITQLSDLSTSDIINLHWVARFQSPVTLNTLLSLGKPIVWTLHDMWAFTGGCHYSAGCQNYQHDCRICPQLSDDPYNLPASILADKLKLLTNSNLTIVTPSRWLAECAKKSKLFQHNRVEVIPYSLETDIFTPLPKQDAKKKIGLNPDTVTILAGAGDANERRKGFSELLSTLQLCLEDSKFQKLARENRIRVLYFGRPNEQLNALNLPVMPLGHIDSEDRLSQLYSAADIFVLPSLEDNLPNTMLEAMSCATPVVAFDCGGIPDLVKDGITGRLVPVGDIHRMAEAIIECVLAPDQCEKMGQDCRKILEEGYSMPVQAERYLDLYRDLLSTCNSSNRLVTTKVSSRGGSEKQDSVSCTATAPLSAPVDTSLGPYFSSIFYGVSLKAIQPELARSQVQLQQAEAELAQVQSQLEQTQTQLQQVQNEIAAMKTSKFWKLRSLWFQVKKRLGLPVE